MDIQEGPPPLPNIRKIPETSKTVAVAIDGGNEAQTPARIIAAGRGALAEKILALAFENNVKVREDADLAEMLALLELDTPIPTEAVVVVAEILAKVYEENEYAACSLAPHKNREEEKGR